MKHQLPGITFPTWGITVVKIKVLHTGTAFSPPYPRVLDFFFLEHDFNVQNCLFQCGIRKNSNIFYDTEDTGSGPDHPQSRCDRKNRRSPFGPPKTIVIYHIPN